MRGTGAIAAGAFRRRPADGGSGVAKELLSAGPLLARGTKPDCWPRFSSRWFVDVSGSSLSFAAQYGNVVSIPLPTYPQTGPGVHRRATVDALTDGGRVSVLARLPL